MSSATPVLPPLPSMMIIGASGCATRWLRFNLDRHPEICAPPRFRHPPPGFLFDDDRMTGPELRAYRRQFVGWDGEPVVVALEPECMLRKTRFRIAATSTDATAAPRPDIEVLADPKDTSPRMLRAMPDVRLVLMVRNPLDRIEIAFRRAVQRGDLPPDADLGASSDEFFYRLVNLDLFAGGMYAHAILHYREKLGADQLLVQFYDDVVDDPASVYRAVLEHAGASPDFVPDGLDRVLYDMHELHEPAPTRLSHEERRTMFDFAYRTQVELLEEMTGRDLSHWDPAVGATV
jgi:hypothetical protein